MNKFFFITTYDNVSGKVLASILNLHPDIKCHTANADTLLPRTFDLSTSEGMDLNVKSIETISIDRFIQFHTDANKKFSGHTQSFTALELQHKTISEKTKTPYRRANIVVSPILRINSLINTWKQTGLNAEKLVYYIEQQLYELENKNKHRAFDLYNYCYFYEHILKTVTKNNLPITESSVLFLIALAKVIAFDSADIPTPGKNFSFEQLLSDEEHCIQFIKFLTSDSIEITSTFRQQLTVKLNEARESVKNQANNTWDLWQTNLLDTYVAMQLKTVYFPHIDKPLSYYYSQSNVYTVLNNEEDTPKKKYSKLVSIQLNSNRPAQLSAYFDNIEETAENLDEIEVLVNIDCGNSAMKSLLEQNIKTRKFTLKYIETPRPATFCDLWKPINNLLEITDPDAYFLLNISDEMFFITQGWDTILKKYVGFFPDDLFRIRLSRNKFRNYFDRWECSFAQDCIPITTKKWVDTGGNWNPCFGPDSFQQLVSFYLAKEGIFSNVNFQRDIALSDIQFAGDVPAMGISEEKRWKHISDHIKAMEICQSYKMQLEARRRAILIKANIILFKNKYINHSIEINSDKNEIYIIDNTNKRIISSHSYKLNKAVILLNNYWRRLYFNKYFGDGIEKRGLFVKSFLHYLSSKYKLFYLLRKKIRRPRVGRSVKQLTVLQNENKRIKELCYLLSVENNILQEKISTNSNQS